MKFIGSGLVWDAENNKTLIEFQNGSCETNDERTIAILNKNGFKELTDQQKPETPVKSSASIIEDDFEPEETKSNPRKEWNDLKRKAIGLGLRVQGKTRDQLLLEIKEIENVDHKD